MRKITIEPVSRIEGHARITIHLGEDGEVSRTQFHVTQVRGFEKFTEGRPFYEMPGITARICGICPVSHLLASSKACDAIMAVRIPPAAAAIREAIHCAQYVQSHALSFFHLSAPDLLLGMDSDPAKRNVLGLAEKHPDLALDGIALRKFGQRVIECLAGERIHPAGIVPGGVVAPLGSADRDTILKELPDAMAIARRTLAFFKSIVDRFADEIASFGVMPSMYAGLVDASGVLQLYDGRIRFRSSAGDVVQDVEPTQYRDFIGEAAMADSYLKAPYYKPIGYPDGIYRVGPLARLNVAERCGTPEADVELAEFRQRFGRVVDGAFHYHYARLIEIVYALERLRALDRVAGQLRAARARPGGGERARRRRRHRGAARHPDPPLQGGRERRHPLGQPDRRHRPQQPGHRPKRRAGRQALRPRQPPRGGNAESGLRRGASLRPVPELFHACRRHRADADPTGRRGR